LIRLYPVGLSHFSQRDFLLLFEDIYIMQECTKCGINKPIDQYDSYFHSTQQKFRIRRYCKACYKKQKDEYKLKNKLEQNPDLQYENNPYYTKCKRCDTWRHKNEYYLSKGKVNYALCKSCASQKEREYRKEYLKENCGSDFVHASPNHFTDNYQKECVFGIMQDLGYLYDDSTGIWTKPGWKEIVDGKPRFLHINKKRKKGKRLTKEDKEKVSQLYNDGYSVEFISTEIGISSTTIYRYVTVKTH